MNNKLKIELVLDVLNSCHWSCHGCVVSKKNREFDSEALDQTLQNFLNYKRDGHLLSHLEIGPVDFLSASNVIEFLDNKSIQKLINEFDEIFITSTLSNIENLKNINKLLKINPNLKLRVFVPVNLNELSSVSKIDDLKLKFNLLKKTYSHTIKFYPFMMGIDLQSVSFESLKPMLLNFYESTGVEMGLNNSCARVKGAFNKRSSNIFNKLKSLNEFDSKISDAGLSFELQKNDQNMVKRGYLFSDNKLYFMPYLNQFINCLDETFVIDSLESFESDLAQEQLLNLHKKTSCMDCKSLNQCLDRGVLKLLDSLSAQDCILGTPLASI